MRANKNLFWILTVFFALAEATYIIWSLIYYGHVEWAGTMAIGLSAVLAAFLGFYLGRVYASQGGELPEDRLDSNIDDGDPEMGFYSPWSWWPILMAGFASIMVLGFAVGIWISFIGAALTIIAVVGWTYEYYRGYFAR